MASFRPFPPQTSSRPPPPPPNQNPIHHPPPLLPSQPSYQSNPYSQPHGFGRGGGSHSSLPSSSYPPHNYNQIPPNSNHHHRYNTSSRHFGPSRTQQHHSQQQQQYPFQPPPPPPLQSSYSLPPPPPPPQSSINLQPSQPPPPPSHYYPSSSQYSQFDRPPSPPPPPPPSSPPSLPPPPPPPITSSVPPSYQASITNTKDIAVGGHGQKKPLLPPKQEKGPLVGKPDRIHNGPSLAVGRVETEEERKLRKRREYEKQKQEEKRQQQLKESQSNVMHKTQLLTAGAKGHGSMVGSRIAERKTTLLGGERIDNRLKKPTTFLCKLKFRNELPDPTAQPKLLSLNTNKDQYSKYTITSLEKMHKPKLFVEPDLGIPLDLLDISVYNTPQIRPPLAPEDEELLRDGEFATPVKQDGIRRKDRPTDKGVSWLVKTQYISPLSMEAAKLSITEKQAKEMRETREGRHLFLENLNSREKQIQAIEESFKASKLRPVHQTNPGLEPVEILPLLPDFDRYDDRFVMAAFDGDPTADSEIYSKLDRSVREEHESQAIMKSFVVSGSDPAKPEKFLAYMAPAPDELPKDLYDEHEDISYSWVREYHWDVRGDDADDPTTYLVSFDEEAARYLPLPTRLVLQKKRAKEGRSSDEVEHFPVPSSVTVRRASAAAAVELKDSGASNGYYARSQVDIVSSKRGRSDMEDGLQPLQKAQRVQDLDHFSDAEDMSD